MNINLTNTGQQLLTRALAGDATIRFSHVALGSGADAGESASALLHQEMLLPITSSTRGQQTVSIKTVYNNADVQTGYRLTEIGIYAADPDGGTAELLYAYGYSPQAEADYVPAAADRTLETELTIAVYVGATERVTVTLYSGAYALASDLTAHTGDTSNPHGTTAAQVGAPTVAALNAHTEDTNNPHGVTAAQVGAATSVELAAHVNDTNNPHGVTPAQIGAATAADLAALAETTADAVDALHAAIAARRVDKSEIVIGTTSAGHQESDCDYLCNGSDDVSQFRAALAAAGDGGKVVILPGDYKLQEELEITQDRLEISGSKGAIVAVFGTHPYTGYVTRNNRHGNTIRIRGTGVKLSGITLVARSRQQDNQQAIRLIHPNTVLAIDGSAARVEQCEIWNSAIMVGGEAAIVEGCRFSGGSYIKIGGAAPGSQRPLPVEGSARSLRVIGNTFTRANGCEALAALYDNTGQSAAITLEDTAIDVRNQFGSGAEANAVCRAVVVMNNVVSTPDTESIIVPENAPYLIIRDNVLSGIVGQAMYGNLHFVDYKADADRYLADNICNMDSAADVIPDADPPGDPLHNWSATQLWLRAGQLGQVLEAGDRLNVEVGGTVRDFDVLGLDEDVPVRSGLDHVLSLQSSEVLLNVKYDVPQFLFAVTAEACVAFGWPSSGMPAGTYHIVLDHGAYGGSVGQDGSYQFTTTMPVPVGGGIRHTTMGKDQTATYAKSQITGGVFVSYHADTVTELESNIACEEGDGGVYLGTSTCSDRTYKIGDYINYTTCQFFGSPRWRDSYLRQVLNSEDAALNWTRSTIWSRNESSAPGGFLHSLDPELRAVLCPVRTRYALGDSEDAQYEDIEDYVKVPTALDIFATAVAGVTEGPVDANGVLKRSTAYSLWADRTTPAERIKYSSGVAKAWWLASRGSAKVYLGRRIGPSGEAASSYPSYAGTAAPCLFIG